MLKCAYPIILVLLGASAHAGARPCNQNLLRDARVFLIKVLQIEASGARLNELLGRSDDELFYQHVVGGSNTEPGWDVVEIRSRFSVNQVRCKSDSAGKQVLVGEVVFSNGWWLSREKYGKEPMKTLKYTMVWSGTTFQLMTPLPTPFLSTDAALGIVGISPYDSPRVVELKSQLIHDLDR